MKAWELLNYYYLLGIGIPNHFVIKTTAPRQTIIYLWYITNDVEACCYHSQ